MSADFPFRLLEAPDVLASCQGWSEDVYRDLLAFQLGKLSQRELDAKYLQRKAILTLDLTGFTMRSQTRGQAHAFLRILDAQKICIPVFQEYGATLIRAFADDVVALFDRPEQALDAAFQVHARVAAFNRSSLAGADPAECCIGIGYGDVYAIGANLAMGDEMNRAAKLGEDIARGFETLVTGGVYEALRHRTDLVFERQQHDDMLFAYFRALPATAPDRR